MKKKSIYAICAVVVLILAVFLTGFSGELEIAIIVILGLLSLFASFGDTKEYGIPGIIIAIGLFIWYGFNSESRDKKEMEKRLQHDKEMYIEQRKQDSIESVNYAIQHQKDSLKMLEDSKRLYALEGDSIFGGFYFGMSKRDYDKVVQNIQEETHGRISIAGHDFCIERTDFYHDKLYFIRLLSANTWVRYYFHDAQEYDDSEGLGDGADIVDKIKERLSIKYGKPNNGDDWHFTYKDISVHAGAKKRDREGLLSTEQWGIFLAFINPELNMFAKKEHNELVEQQREEQKARESEIQRKKESFSSGL